MKKYKIEYILLMIIFLSLIFNNSINRIISNNINSCEVKVIENMEIERLKEENNNLKDSLDLKINNDLEYTFTLVKYRNIYNYLNEVTIYKGKNDGLKVNDTVFNSDGLVGFIKKVYDTEAVVELIKSKNSNISVKINDSFGILKYENNKLLVTNISNYELINVGDKVYTSGLGNLIGNIYVGKVKSVDNDNLEIGKIITIDEEVDFNNLNYLYVVHKS